MRWRREMADEATVPDPSMPAEYERYQASVVNDYERLSLPKGVPVAQYVESLDGLGPDWDTGHLRKVQAEAGSALRGAQAEDGENPDLPIDEQVARGNARAEALINRLGGPVARPDATNEARPSRRFSLLSGLGIELQREGRVRVRKTR
jgi:hypothetical protein